MNCMKFLIFSDLHGSLAAARRIAALAAQERPDAILLLGDILYHGPRNPFPAEYNPPAAADVLTPLKERILAVKGNCDSAVDEAVLPFPLASDMALVFAAGRRICMVHGHTLGPANLPPLSEGDMLLSGHTHIPDAQVSAEGILLCNPGSLALPKDNHPPTYGLLEKDAFSVLTDQGEVYLHLEGI